MTPRPRRIAFLAAWLLTFLLLAATVSAGQQTPKTYTGNPKSMIYHNQKCRYFGCKACVVVFSSAAEAKNHGYRACKKCGG